MTQFPPLPYTTQYYNNLHFCTPHSSRLVETSEPGGGAFDPDSLCHLTANSSKRQQKCSFHSCLKVYLEILLFVCALFFQIWFDITHSLAKFKSDKILMCNFFFQVCFCGPQIAATITATPQLRNLRNPRDATKEATGALKYLMCFEADLFQHVKAKPKTNNN